MRRLAILALVAACGSDSNPGGGDDGVPDAGGGGDAPVGCSTAVDFDPATPIAGPTTRVRGDARLFNAPGVIAYHWTVTFGGAPVPLDFAQADQSAIAFTVAQAGVYKVRLTVEGPVPCPEANVELNASAPGANMSQVRLHVTPHATDGPPVDKLVPVMGGASFSVGHVVLDPGIHVAGNVTRGAAMIGAYLRFMPLAGKEALVEAFANPVTGAYDVTVIGQPHDVLVVPLDGTIAPRLIEDWTIDDALDVAGGTAVTGTVRGPGGGVLAGAHVQLAIDGVPSTVATTTATGAFTLQARPTPGAQVTIEVAPPAASGLPRLAATAAFDLAQPVQVAYGALTLRDLAGTQLSAGGGAKLTLVGELGPAGTVTAGGAPVTAAGTVRIAAIANGAGALPAMLAPAKPLAAVVETTPNTLAVAAVDLTAAVPATITTLGTRSLTTQIRRPDGTPIGGVFADLVPIGALALAGASPLHATSAANGMVAATVADGGHYELRFADPAARGAPRNVPDVAFGAVATAYTLRPGLIVTGTLTRPSSTPIGGASVQIRCSLCEGLERDRSIAEATTTAAGAFTLVVPDPGTM